MHHHHHCPAFSVLCPWEATMSALLSIGLHCKWLSLDICSSKVHSTSKSVSNNETHSLSMTSSKIVDDLTNLALLKQLAISDGKTKFKKISCHHYKRNKKDSCHS